MGSTAGLVDHWPLCESRSAKVQTITGRWMWAEVRGRAAETEVEHVLVLHAAEGGSEVRVPVRAVTGRFLRVAARGDRPGLEFGPVDVAVLRRLAIEAAALPV
jgi:hypothetical protein